MRTWTPALAGAGAVLALAALLQAAIAVGWVSGFVIAPPTQVIAAFPLLIEDDGWGELPEMGVYSPDL